MPDDMDWRLQGIIGLEPNHDVVDEGMRFPQGSTVILVDQVRLKDGRLLAFPIPNATAMLLNASKRAFMDAKKLFENEALKHAPRGFVQFSSNSDAVDFAEYLTISIFAAYTSLECFANELIPPWLTFKKSVGKGGAVRMLTKEEIERGLGLGEKLATVLPWVFGVGSPKGMAIWESFVKLEKARNRVVHMKHADRSSGGIETNTIWKALLAIAPPHGTAKTLIDYFLSGAPCRPGLEFENYRPVRPRWHFECSPEFSR